MRVRVRVSVRCLRCSVEFGDTLGWQEPFSASRVPGIGMGIGIGIGIGIGHKVGMGTR